MKRLLIVAALVLLLGGAIAVFWGYRELRTPVYHSMSGQYIEIPKGTPPAAIIYKLRSAGVIQHEWPILIYLRLTGAGKQFKAGEYDFPSPISAKSVIAKLQSGERRLLRLT